jgi:hypothetical protein
MRNKLLRMECGALLHEAVEPLMDKQRLPSLCCEARHSLILSLSKEDGPG